MTVFLLSQFAGYQVVHQSRYVFNLQQQPSDQAASGASTGESNLIRLPI